MEDQKRICLETAEHYDLEVVAEANDVQSTKRNVPRPGFEELIRQATAGEFDALVIWHGSRLGRNFHVAGKAEDLFEQRPDFVFYDPRGPMRKDDVYREIYEAKRENEARSYYVVHGRKANLREGRLPGGEFPYGYVRSDDNLPATDPDEGQVVKQILGWYCEGVSYLKIAERLNQAGTKTRKRGMWRKGTLTGIVNRAGFYATGDWVTKLGGEVFTIQFEPIISQALLAQVEAKREVNRRYHGVDKKAQRYHLLRAMVTGACVRRWVVRHDKRWPASSRYRCNVKDTGHEHNPDCAKGYRLHELDQLVWESVSAVMLDSDRLRAVVGDQLAIMRAASEDNTKELAKVEKQIEQSENERQWIISSARKQLLAADDLEHQLTEVAVQQSSLEAKREELRLAVAISAGEISDANAAIKAIVATLAEHTYLSVDLSELTADKQGNLPLAVDFEVVGLAVQTETGERVKLKTADMANELGALAYVEECNGDWAQALRYAQAQAQAKRNLIRRFVRMVHVYLDDAGERQVELELAVPIEVDLPASMPARAKYSSDWCRK